MRRGLHSGIYGSETTHRWIMAIMLAGFVVVGLKQTKSRLTTSVRERLTTLFSLVIFNQHITLATITRAQDV